MPAPDCGPLSLKAAKWLFLRPALKLMQQCLSFRFVANFCCFFSSPRVDKDDALQTKPYFFQKHEALVGPAAAWLAVFCLTSLKASGGWRGPSWGSKVQTPVESGQA